MKFIIFVIFIIGLANSLMIKSKNLKYRNSFESLAGVSQEVINREEKNFNMKYKELLNVFTDKNFGIEKNKPSNLAIKIAEDEMDIWDS